MLVEAGLGGSALVGVGLGVSVLVGVQAHQVVHAPAAPGVSGVDQVGAGEVLQKFFGLGLIGAGQVGGGFGGQVRAGVERQQPEQASVVVAEVLVSPSAPPADATSSPTDTGSTPHCLLHLRADR
ncbi:hypothetical protein [Streptomyces sp. NPDC057557]|uniref:hypothetical protein n=1 Tax=Streptomyces sp. NPDC057557 TaxID=3346167 RepID=UPI0036749607